MRVPEDATIGAIASQYESCLAEQAELCRALERLADGLPSCVDTWVASELLESLQRTLHYSHQMEDGIIFPVLLAAHPDMTPIITRLRAEHVEDEDQVYEVKDAIMAFAVLQKREDAESLGYQLRSLFVALRRHLAFDYDHLLPLYRRTDARSNVINLPRPPVR